MVRQIRGQYTYLLATGFGIEAGILLPDQESAIGLRRQCPGNFTNVQTLSACVRNQGCTEALKSSIMPSQVGTTSISPSQKPGSRRASNASTDTPCCSTQV